MNEAKIAKSLQTLPERFRERHAHENLEYDWSTFTGMKNRIRIIDHDLRPDGTEYGEYWQFVTVHLNGGSHPEKKKLQAGRERFEQRLLECFHGDITMTDHSKYVDGRTDITLRCIRHGEFTVNPHYLLNGGGCPSCMRDNDGKGEKLLSFIKSHSDEFIDTSLFEYKGSQEKVVLIDNAQDENGEVYGRFEVLPGNILRMTSVAHPKRKRKHANSEKISDWCGVLEKLQRSTNPNDKLEFIAETYQGMKKPMLIISHALKPDGTEYGEFFQSPYNLIYKHYTHHELAHKRYSDTRRRSNTEFIEEAKKIHDGKEWYDYSNSVYHTKRSKVEVICHRKYADGTEHGPFYTVPEHFLRGTGCPHCANTISQKEKEILEYVKSIVGCENVVSNDRKVLDGMEIDVYVPSLNVGFEYNGLLWHSVKFKPDQNYHLEKTRLAESKGVKLIQIFEDEYLNHRDIVLHKIKHILGKNDAIKIGGRKCDVKEITYNESFEFLNTYHIQGGVKATKYYGAYYNGNLVGVMTFKDENNGLWDLNRFATDYHYSIPGLASKIFKIFLVSNECKTVKSFLDKRWTNSNEPNLYTRLGFKKAGETKPEYRYISNGCNERMHKFSFRKERLLKQYPNILNAQMTEREMTETLGYTRIYDCGLIKYIYQNEQKGNI